MNQLFFETFDLFSKNLDDTYNKYIDIVDPIIDDTIINTRPNSNSTEEIVVSNEDQKEIEYKEENLKMIIIYIVILILDYQKIIFLIE